MVSEKFFNLLENKLNKSTLNGYYNVFFNYKEEGLVLTISGDNDEMCIWACKQNNIDKIKVIVAHSGLKKENNSYELVGEQVARVFDIDNYNSAVDYAYNVLGKIFKNELDENYGFNFKMYYNLSKIRKIQEDVKDLNYEDYHDLAFIRNDNSEYFADLVVMDGKLGLRYSKYSNDEGFDNVYFEECDLDLKSNMTLMLSMKGYLDNFIENEIDYQITCSDGNIKI